MKLNRVTITGADDSTHVGNMLSLQQKYPFVEWGILLSRNRQGSPRYPSLDRLDRFVHMKCAAHLCGGLSREVFEREHTFTMFSIYILGFQRLQLNYNFAANTDWSLQGLTEFSEKFPMVPVILQYNENNKQAVTMCMKSIQTNLHVLYDSSGGRGLPTAKVSEPFSVYTGFSGGLGPHNVEEFVKEIIAYPQPEIEVWIDMEGHMMTEDRLDLEKAERVLEICSKYINI